MQRIAEFEKVSFEQFKKDCMNRLPYCMPEYYKMTQTEIEHAIQKAYDTVIIPKRSTSGSAGYDFVSPFALSLEPQQGAYVPTGIRCKFNTEGWVLMIYPRSSLGINNRMQLDNCVAVIDSDFYYAQNEGHIMAKITNDTKIATTLQIPEGGRFIQGVFTPYGITESDDATETRTGGIGSTGQ